jgi:hypothetical protein
MGDALDEMVAWCATDGTNATGADLVHLGITACVGTGCDDGVKKLLEARNISYITDCGQLKGVTVREAYGRFKLPKVCDACVLCCVIRARGSLAASYSLLRSFYTASTPRHSSYTA